MGHQWAEGFTLTTATPLAGGGVPPSIQDMNGLFEQVSAWAWWQAAGRWRHVRLRVFLPTIGGYPQGAMLRTSSAGIYYLNEVENNTSDPTTGGAGWRQVWLPAGTSQSFASSASWVAPTGISRVKARIWGAGGGATYSNTTQTTGIARRRRFSPATATRARFQAAAEREVFTAAMAARAGTGLVILEW